MISRISKLAVKLRAALCAGILVFAWSIAGAGNPALADGVPAEGEIAEIQDVITAQMQAFLRDDAQEAFSFASPGFQEKIGSPERFMAMVRQQYQPVYRAKKVEFRDPFAMGGVRGIMQPAVVTGPDDLPVYALYAVERQADGAWRISGCLLYELVPEESGLSV